MFLMIVVFLLEVFFAILPAYVGEITTMVARFVFSVTDREINSREEIKNLRDEQAQLNITNEFVRFAKLQRQVDKLMSQIKEKGSERKQHIYYLRMGITVGVYALHIIIVLSLMFLLRDTPLMTINSSWVAPLGRVVAFPTGLPNAVGLGCWLLVSNSVIHRVRSFAKL